jgi:hypothetical protein
MTQTPDQRWVDALTDEDLAFIKRFILASGSLKAMAELYNVSYPTIRLRLDRLIQKIQMLEEHVEATRFERMLRSHFADGRFDAATLKALLSSYRAERKEKPGERGDDR